MHMGAGNMYSGGAVAVACGGWGAVRPADARKAAAAAATSTAEARSIARIWLGLFSEKLHIQQALIQAAWFPLAGAWGGYIY